MSKKNGKNKPSEQSELTQEQDVVIQEQDVVILEPDEQAKQEQPDDPQLAQLQALMEQAVQQEDKYLRLAAEYDNYRRRTAKEKESIWTEVKAETAAAFLPVYDNLERALKQETTDKAFQKGVEMTMTQLKEVLEKLDISEIPALGLPFDPSCHNAVMHIEDDSLEENIVAEVFQAGFRCGEKIIRFSMVQVAN